MKILLGQAYSFHQIGQRDNQEDARYPNADIAPNEQRFFVVCDGVGGSNKGEVASNAVCESFGNSLSEFDFDEDFTNEDFSEALDVAYDTLDKIARKGTEDMATTLTFAAFHAGGATLAHIGDSRIYQIRPSVGIVYRSDDHSLVNQMIHSGLISPEEAEHHPQRNVITRCMEPVAEDQTRCMATVFRTTDVKNGDYFLLCTDGVLHMMSDNVLVELVTSDQPDEHKISQMANLCEDSTDNNTAYLIPVVEVYDSQSDNGDSIMSSDTRRMSPQISNIEEVESVQKSNGESLLSRIFKKLTIL